MGYGNRQECQLRPQHYGHADVRYKRKYITVLTGRVDWKGYIKLCSGHKDKLHLGELRRLFSTTEMVFEAQHRGSPPPSTNIFIAIAFYWLGKLLVHHWYTSKP